jgi:hypothetical protein
MTYRFWIALFVCAALGCGEDLQKPAPEPEHPFDDDPRLVREHELWQQVRSWGDYVEYKPSLSELVDSADAAIVARLESVEAGRVIEDGQAGGFYAELLVNAQVSEVLRDSTEETHFTFSLPLLSVGSLRERDDVLSSVQAALPVEQVVLLLRQRSDRDYHRVVNGYGIWAATVRSPIDAPLEPEPPASRGEAFVYEREISQLDTIDALIDSLR